MAASLNAKALDLFTSQKENVPDNDFGLSSYVWHAHFEAEQGSLEYRVRLVDKEGGYISMWHSVPLTGSRNYLNCICKSPGGSQASYDVATGELGTPLLLSRKSNEILGYARPLAWQVGILPQTWANPDIVNEDYERLSHNEEPLEVIDVSTVRAQTGKVYEVKVLTALAVVSGSQSLSWKLVAINAEDARAECIHDAASLEQHMPGTVAAVREWLREGSTLGSGDREAVLGMNEKAASLDAVNAIVNVAHASWELFFGHLAAPSAATSSPSADTQASAQPLFMQPMYSEDSAEQQQQERPLGEDSKKEKAKSPGAASPGGKLLKFLQASVKSPRSSSGQHRGLGRSLKSAPAAVMKQVLGAFGVPFHASSADKRGARLTPAKSFESQARHQVAGSEPSVAPTSAGASATTTPAPTPKPPASTPKPAGTEAERLLAPPTAASKSSSAALTLLNAKPAASWSSPGAPSILSEINGGRARHARSASYSVSSVHDEHRPSWAAQDGTLQQQEQQQQQMQRRPRLQRSQTFEPVPRSLQRQETAEAGSLAGRVMHVAGLGSPGTGRGRGGRGSFSPLPLSASDAANRHSILKSHTWQPGGRRICTANSEDDEDSGWCSPGSGGCSSSGAGRALARTVSGSVREKGGSKKTPRALPDLMASPQDARLGGQRGRHTVSGDGHLRQQATCQRVEAGARGSRMHVEEDDATPTGNLPRRRPAAAVRPQGLRVGHAAGPSAEAGEADGPHPDGCFNWSDLRAALKPPPLLIPTSSDLESAEGSPPLPKSPQASDGSNFPEATPQLAGSWLEIEASPRGNWAGDGARSLQLATPRLEAMRGSGASTPSRSSVSPQAASPNSKESPARLIAQAQAWAHAQAQSQAQAENGGAGRKRVAAAAAAAGASSPGGAALKPERKLVSIMRTRPPLSTRPSRRVTFNENVQIVSYLNDHYHHDGSQAPSPRTATGAGTRTPKSTVAENVNRASARWQSQSSQTAVRCVDASLEELERARPGLRLKSPRMPADQHAVAAAVAADPAREKLQLKIARALACQQELQGSRAKGRLPGLQVEHEQKQQVQPKWSKETAPLAAAAAAAAAASTRRAAVPRAAAAGYKKQVEQFEHAPGASNASALAYALALAQERGRAKPPNRPGQVHSTEPVAAWSAGRVPQARVSSPHASNRGHARRPSDAADRMEEFDQGGAPSSIIAHHRRTRSGPVPYKYMELCNSSSVGGPCWRQGAATTASEDEDQDSFVPVAMPVAFPVARSQSAHFVNQGMSMRRSNSTRAYSHAAAAALLGEAPSLSWPRPQPQPLCH